MFFLLIFMNVFPPVSSFSSPGFSFNFSTSFDGQGITRNERLSNSEFKLDGVKYNIEEFSEFRSLHHMWPQSLYAVLEDKGLITKDQTLYNIELHQSDGDWRMRRRRRWWR